MAQAATQTMPITGKTTQDEAHARSRSGDRGAAESRKGDSDPFQVHLQRAARKRLRAEADRGPRDRDHQPGDDRYRRQPARVANGQVFPGLRRASEAFFARPEPGALFFVARSWVAATSEQTWRSRPFPSWISRAGAYSSASTSTSRSTRRRASRTTPASARACRPSSYAIEKGAPRGAGVPPRPPQGQARQEVLAGAGRGAAGGAARRRRRP